MSYQITGTIFKIKETQVFPAKKEGGKDFSKRAFVIEVLEKNNEYTQKIELEFIQDKCSRLDGFEVGQEVTVDFNLKGREWDGGQKGLCYFNTLQAWMIRGEEKGPIDTPQAELPHEGPAQGVKKEAPKVEMPKFDGVEEDIPF